MTTIAQYAASHDMLPSEVAGFLTVGSSYHDDDELTYESLDALDGDMLLAEEISGYLTGWGLEHTAEGSTVTVGDWTAETTRGLPRATAIITGPGGSSYETGDAERAAMLLSLPIARAIWDAGYDDISVVDFDQPTGEVEIEVGDRASVTFAAPYGEAAPVIVTDHPLGISGVAMTDLSAILESAELAYGGPLEAWQVLCGAADFEQDAWQQTVETLADGARFYEGPRLTSVGSDRSERTAIVEDWSPAAPIRVIDVADVSDVVFWAPSDVAAAVLDIIA